MYIRKGRRREERGPCNQGRKKLCLRLWLIFLFSPAAVLLLVPCLLWATTSASSSSSSEEEEETDEVLIAEHCSSLPLFPCSLLLLLLPSHFLLPLHLAGIALSGKEDRPKTIIPVSQGRGKEGVLIIFSCTFHGTCIFLLLQENSFDLQQCLFKGKMDTARFPT